MICASVAHRKCFTMLLKYGIKCTHLKSTEEIIIAKLIANVYCYTVY